MNGYPRDQAIVSLHDRWPVAARQRDGRAGGEGKYITPCTTTYDYHHHKYDNACSRRSRIFLKRGPLSCEVPSRRDSVGGGGG